MRQLGRYKIVRRLGAGGMAEVYLARGHGASGFEKNVAIKTIKPEHRGIPERERILIEEARLGARLDHRNLVTVHELGIDRGTYWVCMEFVDGADLAQLLRADTPPEPLALLIAEELALALEYVHTRTDDQGRPLGLVHRDVSPSNILVSRAGEVKLCDFGIAKATLLAEATLANARKGKYAYMSPEQIAGAPLTPSSDQFGLGVTLVELLSGRRPFDGDGVFATMERIKAAEPPPLTDLPADVRAIALRCLARHPSARWSSGRDLRRALAEARRAHPVVGPPELGAWVCERLDAAAGPGQDEPVLDRTVTVTEIHHRAEQAVAPPPTPSPTPSAEPPTPAAPARGFWARLRGRPRRSGREDPEPE